MPVLSDVEVFILPVPLVLSNIEGSFVEESSAEVFNAGLKSGEGKLIKPDYLYIYTASKVRRSLLILIEATPTTLSAPP